MELNEEEFDLLTSNPALAEETKKAISKFKEVKEENMNVSKQNADVDELSLDQLDKVFGGIPYMDDPEEQNDRLI